LSCLALTAAAAEIQFNRDVRPILSDRCYACHGPDANQRKVNLRFDVEAAAKADLGQGRFSIVPGDPARSELIRRVISTNAALRMPPGYLGHEKLPERDIETLRQWIAQGAPWQPHWAFISPKASPAVAANAIDHFILARLEREGLRPSPEADRATLIRRVSLDLTGLPPTPAEVAAFINDTSASAYEKVVDRLLASPRYAERMSILWLQAARYADTNGYQSDGPRTMWRWRDWVIDAFHNNMPFDQFTIEQIAGDLLPNATLSQKIATGFHRNHRTSAEGGIIDEEFRVEYVADRVETTATVWLGLTLGCARCHDHKYDPFPQRDFYRLFAFFNNVPEKGFVYNFGNEEPFIKAPTAEQQKRLDELDRRLEPDRDRWQKLQPELDRAQSKWEKKLARNPRHPDWAQQEGLILDQPLGDAPAFDGAREVNLGDRVARFNHRDPLTLAAWINPETPKGCILSRTEDYWEGTGYGLYLVEGRLRFHFVFRWTDLGLRVETKKPIPLNQWQHVMVTYDGGMKARGVHIYVNGVEQELNVLFDQHLWPIDHKAPFRIGAGGGPDQKFHGRIRDVRVFNLALDAAQAAVVPLQDSIAAIAALPASSRTPAQRDKLRLAFLDLYLSPKLAATKQKVLLAQRERDRFHQTVPTSMVMAERPDPRDTFVLVRGAYDAPGEKVTPETPAALRPLASGWPRNRLGLARWLVSRDNPVTARVAVNRYWQMLFGAGLVKTTEDFGSQGEAPSHPELLDTLAVEFMDSGWNVKRILKTMVMSATYRQSSRVTQELLRQDPENRLLARGPRFRLPAEMVRDQALAVSGLLVEQVGGPSVKPYSPAGLWQELQGGSGYQSDKGAGLYRRSLYTYWKRTVAPPSMVTFDSPTRETCSVRASTTNTPLQALSLMNEVTFVEAARKLAERMITDGGETPANRIALAFRLAVARAPKAQELDVLLPLLERYRDRYGRDSKAALALLSQGESSRNQSIAPAELAAYTGVASVILNMDQTVTKE